MRPSLLSFFLFAFLPTLLRCARCLFRLQCRSILQFDCSFSRISYINVKICLSIMSMTSPLFFLVEDIGFEPMTPCVQGRCSSQLS